MDSRDVEQMVREINRLQAENATLKTRLREQTAQTRETHDKVHDAVVAVLQYYNVVPEGLDVQGHPTEQIVSTCLQSVVTLREAAAAVDAEIAVVEARKLKA